MTDTHVIRLRGPWDYEPLERTAIASDGTNRTDATDLPPVGRVHLPADWGASVGVDFRGRVRYTRRFGLPTNLEPHDQVWLVIEGVDYFGSLVLNGQPLGEVVGYAKPQAFEIGRLLAERNSLVLEVELPGCESLTNTPLEPLAPDGSTRQIHRPGREHLPGGPIGEIRLEIRRG